MIVFCRRATRRVLHRLCVTLLMFAAAPLAIAQAGDAMVEKSVMFRVVIDADGKLVSGIPRDPALGAEFLRAALALVKDVRFVPAQSDGRPSASETTLSLVVAIARQDDGGYKLALKGSRLLTEPAKMVGPVYPRAGMAKVQPTGFIVLGVVVKPDGTVDPAQGRVLQSVFANANEAMQATLVKAAVDAVARWQFLPDIVAGKPVASLTSVPVRFCSRDGCDVPATPVASSEMMSLPRSVTPGQVLPVMPHSDAIAIPTASTTRLAFRITIDASGAVTSLVPTGKPGPARYVQAASQALRSARFFPARVAGRAVSSEMTVAVPVVEDGGGTDSVRVQIERLGYEYQLVSEMWPYFPPELAGNGIDARIRYRVVIGDTGRADMNASKVEMIELSPAAPTLNRRIERSVLDAIKTIRVEPVVVDGKPLPISFTRGLYLCSGSNRQCAFDSVGEATLKAMREPPTLPAGVELAKLMP